MDTKFKSSFIPKTPFGEEGAERQGLGLFGAVAVLLFIVSLVATGGAFLYKMMLKSDIRNLQSQVSSALSAIDKQAINEIISFDKQLDSVREIMAEHVAISKYFEMLEEETVSQIQFTDLKYSAPAEGAVIVSMNGKAKSYAAVALQEDVFLKNPNTISASFSNLKTDEKSGEVAFSFKGEFKNDLIK